MAQQSRAFDQIKAILGRMDRSIDEARTKRLQPEDEPAEQQASTSEHHTDPKAPEAPAPAPGDVRRAGASQYGRARPLRRENDQGSWRDS